MKTRKLPIFLEIMKSSFYVIILILITYTISQLITFWIFTNEYERDLLKDRYKEVISLSKNVNSGISENAFNEYLQKLSKGENDEYIRIYSLDRIYYESQSEIWEDIGTNYVNQDVEIKSKFLNFNLYIVLIAPLEIDNYQYTVQIIRESDMLNEFIESSLPTLIFTLILGLVLSAIGAMYVSKKFINKLRRLIATMNEIKENGINKRAEISEFKDEVDEVNIVFNSMMDELEEAFDEQSRFVADASHEFKTPLTALHGHLSMIKRWGKNDKDRLEKSLDICLNEVERLKKIVNDMLLLSKAEKEEVDLNKLDEIYPKMVVYEVIEQYRVLNPNVKYIVNIEENIKMKIAPNDLKQLLIIFIDNSIKYNDKENIEIEISLLKENSKIRLEVKDNGIGIPKDEIKNVMKRLYKVDKSRVNNNSFGIGLSIANKVVNNYKANINIQSEINKYTKIMISFPG
ncbi:HAMP domain-containing sensor histidine kinase [Clostridium tertium]|jgi:two-component system, OmpR family, sensor histidine kinase ArlS|uniref:histidine kinase n=3 Tax=Clostridium tertium TaxID=1559 RepID=A0A9X3XKA0_9CLOT|nr:HAMP domain-containing sensor histidine kinase [Clostridium tertium]MDU8964928.1 HAMP domain-containing sensor histidine kinase [Clostridium sp.]MDB1932999.1 HAMP domain-containing sensor histidine kinase [Clostridium tertium]MDB1938359.1 HAMP domain-containing sensor histidine kinase [Clostridium tertium]MDB1956449.1 HAMP domain-containing sensor histidine kinase [Clostridium tertium]MDB1958663.1 HAMP domain-containing sensor histidine kinase [Clostridium tertium]